MKVQFIKKHLNHSPGDIAELEQVQANYLVRCFAAEYYDEDHYAKERVLIQHLNTEYPDKIDLTNTIFIIPVYYDHEHRKQNLLLTLSFLRKHFNTNIIIGEWYGYNFEYLEQYATYMHFDCEYFHRTKMINDMCKACNTDIVINWDCDNICDPAQLQESVNAIVAGADISYPFDGRVVRVPRYLFNEVACGLDISVVPIKECITKGFTSVGHAVAASRESFINCGMENENFVSWGPEDSERYNRYRILGLNVHRSAGRMYHMDHFIGENSSSKNRFFRSNNEEFYKVKEMSKKELEEYISTWEWVKAAGNTIG